MQPWGNVLATTGSTVNPHTYVGRLRYYAMAGTGLYHLGYRELAAGVGRFVTVDPAKHDHPYAYAAGNPTAATDPAGLQPARQLVEEGGRAALRLLSSPEGEQARKWLVAAALTAGLSIEELVRRNWKRFCKVRHPRWKHCSFNSSSPEIAALAQFQYDCTKPTDPARWPQRYDKLIYSKPNLPNRLKWQPIAGQRCRLANVDAETGSRLFICPVDYVTLAVLHDRGRARITRADIQRLEQSVVHEPCCELFDENWHYIRIHHSGGPPKFDWF